jgi:hypothetical protein
MINIGMIAKQYGILPSQVRESGTTYDLMIYDVMMSWEQYQADKANGRNPAPDLSQEQMLAMIQRTRQKAKEM